MRETAAEGPARPPGCRPRDSPPSEPNSLVGLLDRAVDLACEMGDERLVNAGISLRKLVASGRTDAAAAAEAGGIRQWARARIASAAATDENARILLDLYDRGQYAEIAWHFTRTFASALGDRAKERLDALAESIGSTYREAKTSAVALAKRVGENLDELAKAARSFFKRRFGPKASGGADGSLKAMGVLLIIAGALMLTNPPIAFLGMALIFFGGFILFN